MPILIAVTEQAYTPDELVDMLRDTYDMAVRREDWKGMFQVIQLILNYGVGKPVQRSIKANIDPEQIRGFLQGVNGALEAESDDPEYIDITPNELPNAPEETDGS